MLLVVAGGIAWGLGFGRQPLPGLAAVALVPLLVAAVRFRGRKLPWLLGWIYGTVGWITGIPWIVYVLETYGGLPRGLSVLLLVALAAFLALYTACFAGLAARWLAGPWGLALVALPALWVGFEWVQSWAFGGFPWNLAGYAWTTVPGALPLAAWIGAWGVSLLVVMVNVGVAAGVLRRSWAPPVAALGASAALLGWGLATAAPPMPAGDGAPVRLLQPNIVNAVVPDWREIRANTERVFAMSESACDAPGALVVWPESAAWPYELEAPERHHRAFRRELLALVRRGCPVLLNSSHHGDRGELYNSAFLLPVAGEPGRYDKRELVPWGERIPLKSVLPFVGKLARAAGEFTAGEGVGLVAWDEQKLGLAICFESAFPELVAESVAGGATLLATISNDAWYGDSAARAQLFQAVRFRAAENRRPLVRAAITGITAVVGADGSVIERLPIDEVGVLAAEVVGGSSLSPFSRAPWALPAACWMLVAFVIVRGWRRRR